MKKGKVLCMLVMSAVLLTGCVDAMPDLTREQSGMIAEYAASLLLKYSPNYNYKIVSEEEVAAAKAKAEEILATYKAGEMTEEAFEALAWENTSDSGVFSNNVRRGQMVDEFEDWLFDDARQIGDTDIVKTPYGFHVMLYRGEEAYKDYLAKNGIANEKYSEHLDANESSVTVNEEAVAKYSNAAK